MILRKPYAFLIKHFKAIHIVILALMTILLYHTNVLLNFFQEYIRSTQMLTGKDFTGQLFSFYMFLLPFIIIVALIILLSVMYYKKKPFVYYILNILVFIGVLVIYNIAFSTARTLETHIMDIRNIRVIRDLLMMIIAMQGISVIFTFIRATGFDIKKFNFGQDLQELEIQEEDNEEFEVEVDIETNIIQRAINRIVRFGKYIYIENRFLINIIFLITFASICFIIYMNVGIYNVTYQEKNAFQTMDFTMEVNKTYLTNQDYRGEQITDKYLVIVELNLKSKYIDQMKINTARAELVIDGKEYYHTNKYRAGLFDLGHTYDYGGISFNFQKELLVYEIPKSEKNKKMLFRYIDTIDFNHNKLNPKYIKVSLNPQLLDKEPTTKQANIKDTIILNEQILGKTSIMIDSFEIANQFILNYKFCVTEKECYDSKEYIRPNANTNYDKALLKINAKFQKDPYINVSNIYSLFNLIKNFGKIIYEQDGKEKIQDMGFSQIRSSKETDSTKTYLEIAREISKSKTVKLEIKIRNQIYQFDIKKI